MDSEVWHVPVDSVGGRSYELSVCSWDRFLAARRDAQTWLESLGLARAVPWKSPEAETRFPPDREGHVGPEAATGGEGSLRSPARSPT